MPWPSNHVPKYRKHRGSGQAMVTLSGVDHYLGPHGTAASRREYDRLVREWLGNGRRLVAPEGTTEKTVTTIISEYWKHARAYYVKNGKPTSEQAAIRCAVKPLKELYGREFATAFGPVALKAVRETYLGQGLSRSTINQNVGRIVRMFRWAAEHELIPAGVPHALATVAGLRKGRSAARESKPVRPVDDATVDATLPYLPPVVADMVRFQRLTGARPTEVCDIRPCDIDRKGKDVWQYRPEGHKTEHHGRERIVFIGPKAQEVLKPYLARDAEDYCFRPSDSEQQRRAARHAARTTPKSVGNAPGTNRKKKPKRQAGDRYTDDSYRRAIYRACDLAFPHPKLGGRSVRSLSDDEKAELRQWQKAKHWAPNRLRHTVGTEIRREFGLEASQVVLGHRRADVTQVYAERDIQKGAEVAKRIG